MKSQYEQEVIKRMVDGNFSKPEDLYPMLVKELRDKKIHVKKYLRDVYKGKSIIDIGGADGWLIEGMDFIIKTVLDKRNFAGKFSDVNFIIEEYSPEICSEYDVIVMSEFLHLFTHTKILKIISNHKKQRIIIIEPCYDAFLDLRLQLWSNGRAITPRDFTQLLGVKDLLINGYHVWGIPPCL